MNILITGHKGFVGTHLYNKLSNTFGLVVTGLDLKTGQDLLTCELPEADVIIHLAGLSGVRQSFDNPTEYWKQNVIVSQRLFDHYAGKRIMYASSSTAYEPWRNPYAMSKHAIEQIAPPNSLGMRFTTVYGPNGREQMLIPKILRNDIQWINTNHKRDFIHIEDLMSAIHLLINTRTINGIVDIGSGVSHQLTDLMQHFGINFEGRIGGDNERLDNKANVELLYKYNWKPKNDLYDYIGKNRSVS